VTAPLTAGPLTAGWFAFGFASGALAAGVVTIVVVRRRRRDPVPVRLIGLLGAAAVAGLLSFSVRAIAGPGLTADRLWIAAAFALLPGALVLYPDDRPPRGLGWTALGVVLAVGVLGIADPVDYARSGLCAAVAVLLVLAVQWWRFESSGAPVRRALMWLALGTLPGLVIDLTVLFATSPLVTCLVGAAAWAVFVVCLCLGLLEPQRRDVRDIAVTVAVHLVTGLLVLTVFATVLSAVQVLAGRRLELSPGALGLIAAVVAAGYAPAVRLLRATMEMLLFGVPRDPLHAASRAGEHLTDDPVTALRSLRESLALPYAALIDGSGRVVAASGPPQPEVARQALSAADPALGHLEVGLRPAQFALHRDDQQVLAVLAPALAQLMQARALRAQVQASRAAVVAAIEEERRRLRRDLHDGLGPRLTGIAYAADAARNLIDRAPDRTGQLLAGLRAEAGEAIAEVRRLVEELRPPSLDQVGLEQTLRQHARHVLRPDGEPVTVDLTIGAPLPPLAAAVEVTAYRIVVEALTNAARHARSDHITIALGTDRDDLTIEVRDNGPRRDPWTPGVGMTSMSERAEMLGGHLAAGPYAAGGIVTARIPLTPA
jgi:signal transduction histidine kinase